MAKHNLTAAANLVGITRQTLYQHIESKGISVETDSKGKRLIDTAELIRVYGSLQSDERKPNVKTLRNLTPANDTENSVLQAKLEAEKEKTALLQERVADLAKRLDDSETERRADKEKFLSLPPPARLDPAAAPETSIAGAGKPAGALSRLRRWMTGETA